MQTLWFVLVASMLTMYVLLDGFDLGAGVIHLMVARNDEERRTVLQAIGPVWDGNEVWLIAAGGTMFFSFPFLYASSFSGFYLPLTIVLWLLMLRGVAIEMRSHMSNPMWATFWDGIFFLGSILLSIFYGAALGNVVRGVPIGKDGYFFAALWTDFNPFSQNPGILDWYTILVGLLALAVLTVHGSNYIALKSEGTVNTRARLIARYGWIAIVILSILTTVATFFVQPAIQASFTSRPWEVVFPVIALAGLVGMGYSSLKKQDLRALLSSGVFIVGMLSSTAVCLYPQVLPAVNPTYSLTIQNTSASQYGQTVGLIWWIVGIVLAVIYFTFTYRLFWGKVPLIKSNVAASSAD